MEAIEAAFSYSQGAKDWFARVIFKCPLCQKRHTVMKEGKGTMPRPLEVECNKGFGTVEVVPYRTK